MSIVKIIFTELPDEGGVSRVQINLEVPPDLPEDSPARDLAMDMLGVYQQTLTPVASLPPGTTLN